MDVELVAAMAPGVATVVWGTAGRSPDPLTTQVLQLLLLLLLLELRAFSLFFLLLLLLLLARDSLLYSLLPPLTFSKLVAMALPRPTTQP